MNWLAIAVSLARTVDTVGLGDDEVAGVVRADSSLGRAIEEATSRLSASTMCTRVVILETDSMANEIEQKH